MDTNREEWISKRAYELWEQSGRPNGQDAEQWAEASAEWDAQHGQDKNSSAPAGWDDEDS
ncbi:DUF2934 domain-containing protein [Rhizobium wenxiniae]|uniref:DUF2934 domain-containing protein n=1 Tax=Rhizobium wenxiniae TaxID=1737357 RepID=UPI001C6DE655|nr:DUF2934 domain-containing protein [Rhizobium wenxiniae]MBW9091379.1 DUF2934 domain-containing protein [Rhizobium wenxiniae]